MQSVSEYVWLSWERPDPRPGSVEREHRSRWVAISVGARTASWKTENRLSGSLVEEITWVRTLVIYLNKLIESVLNISLATTGPYAFSLF